MKISINIQQNISIHVFYDSVIISGPHIGAKISSNNQFGRSGYNISQGEYICCKRGKSVRMKYGIHRNQALDNRVVRCVAPGRPLTFCNKFLG